MRGTAPAIRLITFDVGGTLIHPHPSVGEVYAEVLSRRGFEVSAEAVAAAFEATWEAASREVHPDRKRYAWSPEGERGYWRGLLARTVGRLGGAQPPPGAAEELFERFGHRETWRVYPEVAETLQALSGRGVRMGVISNWDSRLPTLLRELNLRSHFGPILVSALEGYEKPDARIFRLAAERSEVETSRILHVGDQEREDGEGARRAGCRAYLVDRSRPGSRGLATLLERIDEGRDRARGVGSA